MASTNSSIPTNHGEIAGNLKDLSARLERAKPAILTAVFPHPARKAARQQLGTSIEQILDDVAYLVEHVEQAGKEFGSTPGGVTQKGGAQIKPAPATSPAVKEAQTGGVEKAQAELRDLHKQLGRKAATEVPTKVSELTKAIQSAKQTLAIGGDKVLAAGIKDAEAKAKAAGKPAPSPSVVKGEMVRAAPKAAAKTEEALKDAKAVEAAAKAQAKAEAQEKRAVTSNEPAEITRARAKAKAAKAPIAPEGGVNAEPSVAA